MKAAKSAGWWSMKMHGGPYQLSGMPDVLCIKSGRAVFLEVKRPGQKPTPIQLARMEELRRVAGAQCATVTTKDEAIDALGERRNTTINPLSVAEKR